MKRWIRSYCLDSWPQISLCIWSSDRQTLEVSETGPLHNLSHPLCCMTVTPIPAADYCQSRASELCQVVAQSCYRVSSCIVFIHLLQHLNFGGAVDLNCLSPQNWAGNHMEKSFSWDFQHTLLHWWLQNASEIQVAAERENQKNVIRF